MDKRLLKRMIVFPLVGISCGIASCYLPDWVHAGALTVAVLLTLDRIMEELEERE